VEVAGQRGQRQGNSFWQEHYKLMCGNIPDVVHTKTFDRPPQRRSQNVQMSYSNIARGRESPLTTQTQTDAVDDASVDTTVASNLSRQDNTNVSGLSMVTGLSIMKKRMEEIDKQRDDFNTKQQRMDDSISTVTSSVSKLTADILAVRIDMNKMSDKLEARFNQLIAILESAPPPAGNSSPTRKIARSTNKSVSSASPGRSPQAPFGGVVTQLKYPTPPASPSKANNAGTWANRCDSDDEQDAVMDSSASILMEVDSAQAEVEP
jgi:hypothetical protein